MQQHIVDLTKDKAIFDALLISMDWAILATEVSIEIVILAFEDPDVGAMEVECIVKKYQFNK